MEKIMKKKRPLFYKIAIFSFGIICIYYICSFICVRFTTYAFPKVNEIAMKSDEITSALSLKNETLTGVALDLEIGRCKIAISIPKHIISYKQMETRLLAAGYELKKYTKGDHLYLSTEKNGWYYTIDDSWQYEKSGERVWTIVIGENTLFNRNFPFIDLYKQVPLYNAIIYIFVSFISVAILIYTYIRSLVPRKY